jgi:hypothetical protein
MKTQEVDHIMKRFHPVEIFIPLVAVVIYASVVSPTPVLGAVIVFIVSQVVIRGIRNSIH